MLNISNIKSLITLLIPFFVLLMQVCFKYSSLQKQ